MKTVQTFRGYCLVLFAFALTAIVGLSMAAQARGPRALTGAEMAETIGADYTIPGCIHGKGYDCLGLDECLACAESPGGSCPSTGKVYSNIVYQWVTMDPIIKELPTQLPDVNCYAEGIECLSKQPKEDHQCGDWSYCVEGASTCQLCESTEPEEDDWKTRQDWHCQPCP